MILTIKKLSRSKKGILFVFVYNPCSDWHRWYRGSSKGQ